MQLVAYAAISIAASLLVSAVLATDTKFTNEGDRLDENRVIGSRYGQGIPILIGRVRVPINVVWSKDLREVRVETTTSGGGKGGGEVSMTNVSYEYYATFAGIFGKTPMEFPEQSRVLRIWMDKKLVWVTPEGQRGLTGTLTVGGTFEFLDGSEDQLPSAIMQEDLGVGNTPGYRDRLLIVFSELPVNQFGQRIPTIEVEFASHSAAGGASMAEIIRTIAYTCGLDPDTEIDTSEVQKDVYGAHIVPGPAQRTLEDMMLTLSVYSTLTEEGIAFRQFEQPIAAEIPQADLIGGKFKRSLIRDEELPKIVKINHLDPARDYLSNSQQVKRQQVNSVQTLELSPQVAMLANDAYKAADSLLYRAWVARTRFTDIKLPRKYLFLETGDVVKITVEDSEGTDRIYQIRITKLTIGANFEIALEGEAYDPVVLEGVGAGSGGNFPGQGLPSFGTTHIQMIDVPNWEESRVDTPGFYVAASGTGPSWRNAVVDQSKDEGASWETVAFLNVYSIMGACTSILQNPNPALEYFFLDTTSFVDVDMVKGSLASITEEQLLNGKNLALVGGEMIQFRTATLIGEKKYRLTNLLRGRRGSEAKMWDHQPSELFVLLDHLTFIPVQASDLARNMVYRIRPGGSNETYFRELAPLGLNAYPWAPVHVRAVKDAGTGDVKISWYPRSRIGTEFPNDGENGTDTSPEEYQVVVRNAGNTATLRSSTVANITEWVYPAAQLAADFGGTPPTSLLLQIWQRSVYVNGAGMIREVTVNF